MAVLTLSVAAVCRNIGEIIFASAIEIQGQHFLTFPL